MMPYKEIIVVCSTNRMEHINARCGQNPVVRKFRACAFLGVILSLVRNVTSRIGLAIAQEVTGWLVTADDWCQSQSSLCGNDGISGTERGFSLHASVVPHRFQSTGVPHSSTHVTNPAQPQQLTPSLSNARKENWQVLNT
jgi:hypothetical protein